MNRNTRRRLSRNAKTPLHLVTPPELYLSNAEPTGSGPQPDQWPEQQALEPGPVPDDWDGPDGDGPRSEAESV